MKITSERQLDVSDLPAKIFAFFLFVIGTTLFLDGWSQNNFFEREEAVTNLNHYYFNAYGIFIVTTGITLLLRTYRKYAWFMASGFTAIIVFCHLLVLTNALVVGNDPLIPYAFISFFITILFYLLFVYLFVKHYSDLENELEMLIKSRSKAKDEAKKITENLNQKVAELELLRHDLRKTKESHEQTIKAKPYESQLLSSFCIAIGATWENTKSQKSSSTADANSLLSVNSLDHNQDRVFADLVGKTNGSCWLIELKREWMCVETEFKKSARAIQYNALCRNTEIGEIAMKCHWIGWGEGDRKQLKIKFVQYWQNWNKDKSKNHYFDHLEFLTNAFSDSPEKSVGVAPATFCRYMKFLEDCLKSSSPTSPPESRESDSTIADLLVYRDGSGKISFWVEDDIRVFTQSISAQQQEYNLKNRLHTHHKQGPSLTIKPHSGRDFER